MDLTDLAKTLHPLERKVLPLVKKQTAFSDLAKQSGLQKVEVMRALQWLENKGIVTISKTDKEIIDLDKNGVLYRQKGLPEKRLLRLVSKKPMTLSGLAKELKDELNIALGILRKHNAIALDNGTVTITPQGHEFLKSVRPEEKFLKNDFPVDFEHQDIIKELLSRKNIIRKDKKVLIFASLTGLGEKVAKVKLSKRVVDKLTPDMLKHGTWKRKEFRRYDVEINVPMISGGRRHFTNQVVEYIKQIWLDLGFKEMTGNIVQSSFWDLDALFVPQDHPARDMQDTFYVKKPGHATLPKEFVDRVKKTHETGWTTGSLGWQDKWSEDKARENLLRTHTTVLSAQTIATLKKSDLPAKFFSVGKCFRNEALDWKHLFEFYQVEGIVVDPDANFSNLVGYLKIFFKKMGYPDVRVRPGHFPYTEPSCEVEVYHPVKKEWVELGGSGIFRPEVTKPLMGFEVPVLAWGLGLDRIIKEYWEMQDIRELYKNDLKQLREQKVWLR